MPRRKEQTDCSADSKCNNDQRTSFSFSVRMSMIKERAYEIIAQINKNRSVTRSNDILVRALAKGIVELADGAKNNDNKEITSTTSQTIRDNSRGI